MSDVPRRHQPDERDDRGAEPVGDHSLAFEDGAKVPSGWTERISTNGTTTTIANDGALAHGTKSLLATDSSNNTEGGSQQAAIALQSSVSVVGVGLAVAEDTLSLRRRQAGLPAALPGHGHQRLYALRARRRPPGPDLGLDLSPASRPRNWTAVPCKDSAVTMRHGRVAKVDAAAPPRGHP